MLFHLDVLLFVCLWKGNNGLDDWLCFRALLNSFWCLHSTQLCTRYWITSCLCNCIRNIDQFPSFLFVFLESLFVNNVWILGHELFFILFSVFAWNLSGFCIIPGGILRGSRRERLLSKFVENECEKIDRLMELYMR